MSLSPRHDFWSAVVTQFHRSGLTQADFCRTLLAATRGGETAAVLMSLCTTCKELEIDPQAYLRDVLDRISTHPAGRIEELLPDRWQSLRRSGDAAEA